MGYIEALLQNCECIQKSGFRHLEIKLHFLHLDSTGQVHDDCMRVLPLVWFCSATLGDSTSLGFSSGCAQSGQQCATLSRLNQGLAGLEIEIDNMATLHLHTLCTHQDVSLSTVIWKQRRADRTQTLPRNAPPSLHRGSLQFQPASLCTLLTCFSAFLLSPQEKGLISFQLSNMLKELWAGNGLTMYFHGLLFILRSSNLESKPNEDGEEEFNTSNRYLHTVREHTMIMIITINESRAIGPPRGMLSLLLFWFCLRAFQKTSLPTLGTWLETEPKSPTQNL